MDTYVIWDPAPNRLVGIEENWTRRQATQFLKDHSDEFSSSARIEKMEDA